MDDKELVRSCLIGEVDEYKKVVDKYKGKIMTMALNMLRNREDAEDACQDVFIRAYKNLDSYNFSMSFKNWLFSILYNRCLDQIRKKRRFYSFINRFAQNTSRLPVKLKNTPGDNRMFSEKILMLLKSKERLSLLLWAREGYTSEEIAGVLGCAPSTARVHLFNARKKIKNILERKNEKKQKISQ
jgi:RNA polymerase sigma-70 factor (ECF subfamily)